MKQKCARKAFELIEDGMTIGLGGGATVALLIEELERQNRKITAVTPSGDTMELCCQHHIPVLPLEMASHIDLAFDGCDELDMELNALKSCGGIHTREKIVAAMAEEYILLADETKLGERLKFHVPITIEAVPAARAYVKARLRDMGAVVSERRGDKKAGLVISDDGNYLLEAVFPELQDSSATPDEHDAISDGHASNSDEHVSTDGHASTTDGHDAISDGHASTPDGHDAISDGHASTPDGHASTDEHDAISDGHDGLTEGMQKMPQNLRELSQRLDGIPGIVGHSLFCGLASKAIVVRQDGIDILNRN